MTPPNSGSFPSSLPQCGAPPAPVWILAVLAACTSELNAPDCYNDGNSGVPRCQITGAAFETDDPTVDTQGGTIAVDCSLAPDGALGANYRYTPTVSGAQGTQLWDASGLPEGILQDPETGELSGVPTTTGTATVGVVVLDAAGNTGSATCSFSIHPALAIDLEGLLAERPGCIEVGESLLAHVVPATGDGSTILCDTPTDRGSGKLPPTVTVDPATCALAGDVNEPGIGTWAFIVRARQSGRELFVPYCATDSTPDPGAYTITVEHSGLPPEVATHTPMIERYTAGASFTVGGNGDPLFRIVSPAACGSSCAYRYGYSATSALFDLDTLSFEPETLVTEGGAPVGFSHNLLLLGPPAGTSADVLTEFSGRPWIFGLTTDYCLAEQGAACFDGDGALLANGRMEFSIIMFAQP